MTSNVRMAALVTAVVAAFGWTGVTQAADYIWDGGDGSYDTVTNWDLDDLIPNEAGDTATIDNGATVSFNRPEKAPLTIAADATFFETVLQVDSTDNLKVGDLMLQAGPIPKNTTITAFVPDTSITLSNGIVQEVTTGQTVTPLYTISFDALTVSNGSTLSFVNERNTSPMTVNNTLSNSATIEFLALGQANNKELFYNGTATANSGAAFNTIDGSIWLQCNNTSSARGSQLVLPADNINAGTIDITSVGNIESSGAKGSFGARLVLTGSDTFVNKGTITATWGLNHAYITGLDDGNHSASYRQDTVDAVTELNSIWTPDYDEGNGFSDADIQAKIDARDGVVLGFDRMSLRGRLEAHDVFFDAGTLRGDGGLVVDANDNIAEIGDGAGTDDMDLSPGNSVGTLWFGTTEAICDRFDRGTGSILDPTATSMRLNSDADYNVEIDADMADLLMVYGDVLFNGGGIDVTELTAPTETEYKIIQVLNDGTSYTIDTNLPTLGGPDGSGWALELRSSDTELWLIESTGPAVLLGDANNDGVVSADDFAAVQTNFGNTGAADGLLPGDANDDGVVSADDFAAIQTNFGNVLGAAAESAPVPEPATMALLALGGAALLKRRRA